MKLLNIIPAVDAKRVWTKTVDDYSKKYLLPDTEVVTVDLEHGPEAVESRFDEVFAMPEVIIKCIEAEEAGYDGVFINCFGDPGLAAARERIRIPVFGGFMPAILFSFGLAERVGIISILPEVMPLIREVIEKNNFAERIVSVRYVNTGVLDLELDGEDTLPQKLADEAIRAIEEDGMEALVLGCTAMVGVKERVEELLAEKGHPIPVIEAAQTALVMLEANIRMGMKHSLKSYMPTPKKRIDWWGEKL